MYFCRVFTSTNFPQKQHTACLQFVGGLKRKQIGFQLSGFIYKLIPTCEPEPATEPERPSFFIPSTERVTRPLKS
jgi:hypothetical protein